MSNGEAITPNTFDIIDLQDYLQDITTFIFADNQIKKSKDKRETISINYVEGSAKIIAIIPLMFAPSIQADLDFIQENRLDKTNPKRLKIIQKWQRKCIHDPTFSFDVKLDNNKKETTFHIDHQTNFSAAPTEEFIEEEIYLYGIITAIGGKKQSNIHLDTEDYGIVIIDTERSYIASDEKNWMYKPACIRAKVFRNSNTGLLKNNRATFISLESHNTTFDKDKLEEFIEKSTPILKELPPNWVRDIRGEL